MEVAPTVPARPEQQVEQANDARKQLAERLAAILTDWTVDKIDRCVRQELSDYDEASAQALESVCERQFQRAAKAQRDHVDRMWEGVMHDFLATPADDSMDGPHSKDLRDLAGECLWAIDDGELGHAPSGVVPVIACSQAAVSAERR